MVVIEEFLDGPEVSVFALADGAAAVALLPAQDYKRAHDGDPGPNTGGMGAYAPLDWAPPGLADETLATVVQPALDELSRRGTPFRGLLYAGLSLTSRRAPGGRVQRPLRRPGDPGRPGPAGHAARRAARRGGRRAAWPGRARRTGRRGRRSPWSSPRKVTRTAPAAGDEIDGLADAAASTRRLCPAGGHRAPATAPWCPAAAGSSTWSAPGPDLAQARAAAYAAAGRIQLPRRLVPHGHRRPLPGVSTAAGAAPATGPADAPLRVTTLELFFDLVFAFTLTQLTLVANGTLSVATAGQVLLVFGLLWWMYEGYAWLTNARPPVHATERLLLLVGMAGFLVVGLAIPHGFSTDGVVLGLGYLVVVLVHAVLYYRVNANIIRIAPFNITSALLVTAAGAAGGAARYPLWVAALAIQLGSPLVVHPRSLFALNPAHLSERHSTLLIVALGESVAAIGAGAASQPGGVTARLVPARSWASPWPPRCGGSSSAGATRSGPRPR